MVRVVKRLLHGLRLLLTRIHYLALELLMVSWLQGRRPTIIVAEPTLSLERAEDAPMSLG